MSSFIIPLGNVSLIASWFQIPWLRVILGLGEDVLDVGRVLLQAWYAVVLGFGFRG